MFDFFNLALLLEHNLGESRSSYFFFYEYLYDNFFFSELFKNFVEVVYFPLLQAVIIIILILIFNCF